MNPENIKNIMAVASAYKIKGKYLHLKAYLFLLVIVLMFYLDISLFSNGSIIQARDYKSKSTSESTIKETAFTLSDTLRSAKSVLTTILDTASLNPALRNSIQNVIDNIPPGEVISTNTGEIEIERSKLPPAIKILVNQKTFVIMINIIWLFGIFLSLFLMLLLHKSYRYNIRLVHFYRALADSIILALNDDSFKFENIVRLLTPNEYDFHIAKYSDKIFELSKIALENSGKCCCKEKETNENEKKESNQAAG